MISQFICQGPKAQYFLFEAKKDCGSFLQVYSVGLGYHVFYKNTLVVGGKIIIDACEFEIIELQASDVANKELTETEKAVSEAYLLLRSRAKEIHQSWIPNWEDPTQKKWFPVFRMQGGFAFTDSTYTYSSSNTMVGSRFCFPTLEMAERFGKKNLELYKIIMTT